MSPAKIVSAHSPAPYRPSDPLHHAELFVAKTDDLRDMESIAEVGPAMRDDEALANACLFEVAGELLDAARDLVALYGDFQPGEAYADPPEHPLSRARALILKYEDNVREGTEAWERMMAERAESEPTIRDVQQFRQKVHSLRKRIGLVPAGGMNGRVPDDLPACETCVDVVYIDRQGGERSETLRAQLAQDITDRKGLRECRECSKLCLPVLYEDYEGGHTEHTCYL